MLELFLYLFLFSDYRKGVLLSRNFDHEASEKILSKTKSGESEYQFYRMINAYKLNKKEEGIKWANCLIHSFQEVPIRYYDMAIILKADMQEWSNENDDLEDISREMTKAKDRLANNKGGKETQEIQKNVLNRLDKMIKDLEDQKNQKEMEEQQKQQKQEQQISPPKDTHNETEQGTGKIDRKRVKELAEVWGKLPEKERAKAMVELTKNLPRKDRVVIENYFKEMMKKSSQRKFE